MWGLLFRLYFLCSINPCTLHVSTAETTGTRERLQQSLSHETTAVVVSISHLRHYFHKLLYNF